MTITLWKTVPQPVELRRIVNSAPACTCHVPHDSRFGRNDVDPRPIILLDGSSEWQHVDDGTAASTHHAHMFRSSADCDGPMDRSYVDLPHPGAEGSWEFEHWMRVVRYVVNAASDGGTLTTSKDDNGRMTAEWSARTDEGYEHETATMCIDPHCAYERSSQRDYYAEAMGY